MKLNYFDVLDFIQSAEEDDWWIELDDFDIRVVDYARIDIYIEHSKPAISIDFDKINMEFELIC